MSLPAWGAWIEIVRIPDCQKAIFRRSPRGGRGLKFRDIQHNLHIFTVAPRVGGVD